MKSGRIFFTAAAAALLLGTAAQAAQTFDGYPVGRDAGIQEYWSYSDMPDSESMTHMRSSIDAAMETQKQRMQQAPREVADGMAYTMKALRAMKRGDMKVAETSLEASSKLFGIALTNDPSLDMVPIADDVRINDLVITPDEVAAAIHGAKKALNENRTQEARMLLKPLHEQMTIETQLLPMKLYPDATRIAYARLKKGDRAGAIAALQEGFGTIVTEEAILPLPLLKAEAFVKSAAAQGKTRKKEALVMLAHAQAEMDNAVLLGYTSPDDVDYKMVKDQMAKVEKAVGAGEENPSLFKKLMDGFEALLKKPANGLHTTS